jgi:AcrR family transcriptional regulator
MTDAAPRALRSDAAANRERVLLAAARAIKREGEKVPMASIAHDAGVGVGTIYRHFPARPDLLAALERRSYEVVLDNARAAAADAAGRGSANSALEIFFERTIRSRHELILPLHGGPVSLDAATVAVRTEISDLIDTVLARGRLDATIRSDATAVDVIVAGAVLAQPLPHVSNWDELARRQARIALDGLAAPGARRLPGDGPTRIQLEAGFASGRGD